MTDPVPPRDDDPDTTPLASGSPVPPSGDPAVTSDESAQVYPAGPPPGVQADTSTSRLTRLRARRVSLGVVLAALLVGGVLGAGAMAVAGHGDDRGSHRFADQQGRNGGPGGSGLPGYGGRNDGGQFGGQFGGPGMNRRGNGNGFPDGNGLPGNQGNGPAPVPSASPSTAPSTSSST